MATGGVETVPSTVASSVAMPVIQRVALPLHVQMLQKALRMDCVFEEFDRLFKDRLDTVMSSEGTVTEKKTPSSLLLDVDHAYNFSHVTEERRWVQDLLLSKSDGSGSELSDSEQFQMMLELQHKRRKLCKKRGTKSNDKLLRYKHFSSGLLLPHDPYPEHLKTMEQELLVRGATSTGEKVTGGGGLQRRELWAHIVKKEIPRTAKQFSLSRHIVTTNNKKIAQLCQREVRKTWTRSQRASKEVSVQPKARRLMREALVYWRKYEKVEKEQRKKAEKEASEQNKLNQEMMEAKKQQRKLNFLITQTELYAHFMAKKLTGEADNSEDILRQLEDGPAQREIRPGVVVPLEEPGEYNSDQVKAQVMANVQSAVTKQHNLHKGYNDMKESTDQEPAGLQESFDKNFSLATPMLMSEREVPQPSMFNGKLKVYQLKGMNWLANLYDQGINGILADEMGLGKTVQSIAFLSHLAEHQNTWGPFLIVSPASTLHNWQQEASRFVPRLKALPYWGSPPERKVIRKYWNQKLLCKESAPFHILITSYQLVVQDMKYFQRIKWQYMILDEAQAIKSSTSIRWKVLLSFNCRNRLLLTGTPIQNTMQELWALLHFIMPTMFDSHEEFNEWFSKDIESHAEKKSVLDEHQLSRLHLILKPFMLRRIKKDVEHEMADKIEVHLSCELSTRQRLLYQGLRQRISVEQLLQSAGTSSSRDSSSSHLLNLVMQFRKVCNHPDLFERRNVESPVSLAPPPYIVPTVIPHLLESDTMRTRLLTVTLGVHTPDYIHHSTLPDSGDSNSCWSFLRLTDLTPQDASSVLLGSLSSRLKLVLTMVCKVHLVYQRRIWGSSVTKLRSSSNLLLLWPSFAASFPAVVDSPTLSSLVFTGHTYTHTTHTIHSLRRGEHATADLTHISSTVSHHDGSKDAKSEDSNKSLHQNGLSLTVDQTNTDPPHGVAHHCIPTDMPKFLITYQPKAHAPLPLLYCYDRSAEYRRLEWVTGGPPSLKKLFLNGLQEVEHPLQLFHSPLATGLTSLCLPNGWSHIHIPNKETMIFDSGKMVVLDKLLFNLKSEGHRVLIYSQMTRVIDLLEEFMAYRRYKYIRLDGSSKISDRRDMVSDFQSNVDIFAFLLSTRAGGLGINLTAADTVIFFDSDWNPTVDQQAMDRAHRLGQTKQVTVYRLVVRGTIEERILQRAREKSEIQKMVISGGDFKPDTLKAKDMVSLLLHDDEMESRFLAKQAEKKLSYDQLQHGKKSKKRKTAPNGTEVEPSHKRTLPISATPSPLLFTSRPDSVLSAVSGGTDMLNGDTIIDVGDASEVNGDMPRPSTTPVRAKNRRGVKSSAPLGGRGRIQRTGKKPASRNTAAASAGAIAGAMAASNAAYAAYGPSGIGYGVSPVPSHSLAGSPGSTMASNHGSSTQSSPRTSPGPPPFVATSFISTPPFHKN